MNALTQSRTRSFILALEQVNKLAVESIATTTSDGHGNVVARDANGEIISTMSVNCLNEYSK